MLRSHSGVLSIFFIVVLEGLSPINVIVLFMLMVCSWYVPLLMYTVSPFWALCMASVMVE